MSGAAPSTSVVSPLHLEAPRRKETDFGHGRCELQKQRFTTGGSDLTLIRRTLQATWGDAPIRQARISAANRLALRRKDAWRWELVPRNQYFLHFPGRLFLALSRQPLAGRTTLSGSLDNRVSLASGEWRVQPQGMRRH